MGLGFSRGSNRAIVAKVWGAFSCRPFVGATRNSVGWATRKSWGGLFVLRGVVAVAVVWGVVAVYGAGAISESGPIVSVLRDCAGGYWGDGAHRKFQLRI